MIYKNCVLLATVLVLVTGLAVANGGHGHDGTTLNHEPGKVTPDSPLYGFELAWDNAAVSVGLKSAGAVAQERAAEARAMAEKNDTQAMQRAVNNMGRVVEEASDDDVDGLQKAEAVLQEVMQNAPEEAQQGLQTALDNVRTAREQAGGEPPAELPGDRPNETGPDTPGEMPDGPSGMAEDGNDTVDMGGQADQNQTADTGNQQSDTADNQTDSADVLPVDFTLESTDGTGGTQNTFYYDGGARDEITVPAGEEITITFAPREGGTYFAGAQYYSNPDSVFGSSDAVEGGETTTVSFTAEQDFTIEQYWPNKNEFKSDITVHVE